MAAMALRHFDLLDYVEKSKELGVDEKIAKYQARQLEQAISIAVDTSRSEIENKELATKHDIRILEKEILTIKQNIKELDLKIEQAKTELRSEIHKSKFELVVWMGGFLIASGVIQHFFK